MAGSNFAEGATADFGAGIAVQKIKFNSSSELVVTVRINRNAASGSRDVTITNPDGKSGTKSPCFTVI